jgi:glycerol uptake facilitator-like aquaporin
MRLSQRLAAEWLGTAFLLAAIIGSGIMAERLAHGDGALALLCNSVATGTILGVLILIFGPISGAHFNPLVSPALLLRGELTLTTAASYVIAQLAGAFTGVLAAHAMFALPLMQVSMHARSGGSQCLSEAIATFGLLITIFGCAARKPDAAPYAIGGYIVAAFWFTASTSFANPAVTLARAYSDTFAGIAPSNVPGFVIAQCLGTLAAIALAPWLWKMAPAKPANSRT